MIPERTHGRGRQAGLCSGSPVKNCPRITVRITAHSAQENSVRKLSSVAAFAFITVVSFTVPSYVAQGRGGAAAPDTRPAPRWPDGHINLGAVPGSEMGLWDATPTQIPLARPDVASDFGLFAADAREPTDPFLAAKPKLSQIPFQPWARSLFAVRVLSRQEPYTRCKPSSGARQVATAYGTQFLEVPELQRFYICLLYTSDAADERSSVDLGGR